MNTLDQIPVTKMERAGKLVQTGVKLGGNYLRYYGEKLLNPETDRNRLDEANARDVYDGLKRLKGSALKVAQMLSMEKNLLPQAYVDRFSLAQFSVPPLSAPLVRKTFKKSLGAHPEELFEKFDPHAVNAASIGQVHRAVKEGRELAVKVQYPGVADSISSDLALVRPIALRMLNLSGSDTDKYFQEVEAKLLEETDYLLELERSQAISQACRHLPGLRFPVYYPKWSSERILTMDWMHGRHLSEFTGHPFDRQEGDRIGQALWDFYMFQMHRLRTVHADPHPGNFLVGPDGTLIVIDFGCIKEIPDSFYEPYFDLARAGMEADDHEFTQSLVALEILTPYDKKEEVRYFKELFREMLELFTRPLRAEHFDFSDPVFWQQIASLGERFSNDTQLRKMNSGRGSRHFLYMNRTFFGLYNLLHDLQARVATKRFESFSQPS